MEIGGLLLDLLGIFILLCIWDMILGRKKKGSFQLWGDKSEPKPSQLPTLQQLEAEYKRQTAIKMDYPGRFKVIGVDRASGFDVVDYVTAQNAANARTKSERNGTIVTSVWPDLI